MKFLVTGGAGFIGSHLAEALVNKGEVIVYDDFSSGSLSNLSHIKSSNLRIVKGSINDSVLLKKHMQGITHIFHCASLRSVIESVKNPEAYYETNVVGTRILLEHARFFNVKKIIFPSSSAVYGNAASLPIKESEIPKPLSPYAENKLLSEKDIQLCSKKAGIGYTIFRLFNVYGPRQDYLHSANAIPVFIQKMLSREPPIIYGDGSQTRDFVYIKDVVDASLSAIDNADNLTLNIGSGKAVSINDLAREIASIIGAKISQVHTAPVSGECRHSAADISLAKSAISFTPKTQLREGLKLTIDYYKELFSRV